MKIFEVYIKTDKRGIIKDIELLKIGFSWGAFIFSIFWLLYYRVWQLCFVLLPVVLSINWLEIRGFISNEHSFVFGLGLQLLIGFSATEWLGGSLTKRGYRFAGVVTGNDVMLAERRFFDHHPHVQVGGL